MKDKNQFIDAPSARRLKAKKKEERIKRAAILSRTKTTIEIMTELGISKRTLQRYMADPLWQEHDGQPLTFTGIGRPQRETLSTAEKRLLDEAHAIHQQGRTWVEAAAIMEIPFAHLHHLRMTYPEYLRNRYPARSDQRYITDTENLKRAYQLHASGMKWKDIPDALGITWNQLRYLRRKYTDLD